MSDVLSAKRIHLIGIGGVGMAGLALLLKSRGAWVDGCDLQDSPRTEWLRRQGIPVAIGHDPAHLTAADCVIATPAVTDGNPERQAASARLCCRGEALAELANARETIAICGSHGKTTTATWIARLLLALGEDVAWCIGGETGNFPVAGTGKGPLVIEADESDGTLALYRAHTLVVNRCDYDHPDHFKTPDDYFACFDRARAQAGEVVESEKLDCSIVRKFECSNGLPLHNLKNMRAAVEVALRRGHKLEDIAKVLPEIVSELPDRRFQAIWPTSLASRSSPFASVMVVTDYAHHPAEMKCAVAMARKNCRGTLRVLFQPHRYSRTRALCREFPKAFAEADETILCPTYAAFEMPVEGGDIADLYRVCREQGVRGLFLAQSCLEAWEHAFNSAKEGDVILLLGAGDIISLVPQVQADLSSGIRHPVRHRWIGMGSNTWQSDLKLSVAYERTSGPADAPGATLRIPWMAGIPGTIGGWVKMNAGAFGHSISEVLEAVKVDGVWIDAADCGFGYRHSDIVGEIQDVRLNQDRYAVSLQSSPADFLARRKHFPAGTFGSFFKNPPNDSAGRLLEAAGAKELRVGGAFVWQEHANVIVRGEGATASDVLALARLMYNCVFFRFGVALEPEVVGIMI